MSSRSNETFELEITEDHYPTFSSASNNFTDISINPTSFNVLNESMVFSQYDDERYSSTMTSTTTTLSQFKNLNAYHINSHTSQIKALKNCVEQQSELFKLIKQDTDNHWKQLTNQKISIERSLKEIQNLRWTTSSQIASLSDRMDIVEQTQGNSHAEIFTLMGEQQKLKSQICSVESHVRATLGDWVETREMGFGAIQMRLGHNKEQFEDSNRQLEIRISAIEDQLKQNQNCHQHIQQQFTKPEKRPRLKPENIGLEQVDAPIAPSASGERKGKKQKRKTIAEANVNTKFRSSNKPDKLARVKSIQQSGPVTRSQTRASL